MNATNAATVIDKAQGALRDLYGLVPEADRKYAYDYARVLENALRAYRGAHEALTKIDAAKSTADRAADEAAVEITMLEER